MLFFFLIILGGFLRYNRKNQALRGSAPAPFLRCASEPAGAGPYNPCRGNTQPAYNEDTDSGGGCRAAVRMHSAVVRSGGV